ncbi:uncharacterized protein LOC112341167 [Selaginella moellendorffii]|uniref:uncharacterized protein LOC112341167 n=1 Tax=Selaginella moellendorffii TaxID=88036 RepID=UPI000D1C54B3|nr:uncharacterized protein LOC112341167 [Selaginella moellendorffii]|eukprot:XP_024516606.1 uncharacterized protein LOC112341167 [Selaginella moellendorffii]
MDKEALKQRLEQAIQGVAVGQDSSPDRLQTLQDLVSQGSGSSAGCSKCSARIFPRARICFVCGSQIPGRQQQEHKRQPFEFEKSVAFARFLQSLSSDPSVEHPSSFSTPGQSAEILREPVLDGEHESLGSFASSKSASNGPAAEDPVNDLLSQMGDLSFMLADRLVVPVGGSGA